MVRLGGRALTFALTEAVVMRSSQRRAWSDRADNAAAVSGLLAGAYYGENRIPASLAQRMALDEEVPRLGDAMGRRQVSR
jgi:hypothetical protein